MLKGKKKIHIEISEQEINQLVDEIELSNLSDGSREKLVNALRALIELDRLVGLKSATIARLRKIFGKQSFTVSERIRITTKTGPAGLYINTINC